LIVENVCYSYGKSLVLDHVSFTCHDGIIALLGNNGAGKTTLMSILAGLKKADAGNIILNGKDLLHSSPYPIDQAGYLPQNFDIYHNISGYDFLSYVFDMKDIRVSNKKEAIQEIVEKFNLQSVIRKKIGSYSGGYKRRLGIAQAVLGKPALIIIDEPTAGLDPEQRVEFRSYLSEISKETITLISTHIIEDVELYSNKILILKDQSIQFEGPIDELISVSVPNIYTAEIDLETLLRIKKYMAIIEEKRIHSNVIKIRFIKDRDIDMDHYHDKEISLENAYVYFQKR
jgi:ABC-type multidrug transport system ATPase subunit